MNKTPNKFDSVDEECFDLVAKVTWLIEQYPGWSEDDTFTFPDGDTWTKFEVDPAISPTFKVDEVDRRRLPRREEIDNE